MFDAGEDPLYIGRRLVRMAVEDIGLADPQALAICNAAKDAYDYLGSPEGELALAEACVYLATAPKSNAVYTAYKAAMRAAKENGSLLPPKHILNAPTKLMKGKATATAIATIMMSPTHFPARIISPRRWAERPSTTLRSAASNARSASGWSGGTSFGATGIHEGSIQLCHSSRPAVPQDALLSG